MRNYQHLFSPGRIGSLYLKNRVVMAPLGSRLTSESGAVTADMIEYYSQRALGGAAAITVEAMAIDYPLAAGKPNHVRFCNECYIPGHAKLVERIHECGAKVFAMLWHAGINKGALEGQMPVGPSAILNPNTGLIPRELTTGEIRDLVQKFGTAAKWAMLCGYDAVNVHAAHGYLISSFVSEATNKRTDEYGGSFENRIRFPLEILRSIRENTRPDYPVIFRINGDDFIENGISPEQAAAFAMALEAEGVDAIDVSAGVYATIDKMIEPIQYEEGWKLYLAQNIRKHVKVPVFGVGVIHSPEVADEAIRKGMIDFACMGRELLCEPQWVNKILAGEDHFPRCIGCGACFERIGRNLPLRCSINPLAGRELHAPKPAKVRKKVAVIGAGPAGITVAITAAERGHAVTLYERSERIGGQLNLAGRPPRKSKILDYIGYLEEELCRSDVCLRLNTEFTVSECQAYDDIIIAAGAFCKDIPIAGSDECRITSWELLEYSGEMLSGKQVVILGGGSVGCEAALYAAEHGAGVSVIELRSKLAADMDNISRMKLLHELGEAGVLPHVGHTVEQIENGTAVLKDISAGTRSRIPCSLLVIAVGSARNADLAQQIFEAGKAAYSVGDCAATAKIGEAVRAGFDAAASI